MADEFKVLSDIEHYRLRPNMYIGSTTIENVSGMFFGHHQELFVIPGLLKIISEILDNSIDEAIRTDYKYANKIGLKIEETSSVMGDSWKVTVHDNGRGIPVELIKDQYRPVVAWTTARAGSNFSENRVTIGANGVGSFATCVFSTEFIGKTSDGKNELTMVCGPLAQIKSVNVTPSKEQYTEVSFTPDLSAFHIDTISDDHLKFFQDRLENLAICHPKIQFTFNDVKIKFKSVKEYALKFSQDPVVITDDSNILIFGPSDSLEEFRMHSYVNGLWIKDGGSHIDYVLDKVVSTLREHIKKKHKIDVLPNAIKSHLTFVSILRNFVDLKFDSQSKVRITNTTAELSRHFSNFDFDKISRQILNSDTILTPMISAILLRKELEENRELAKKQKAVSKTRIVNHIVATDPDPENRMLFVVEGLSSIGNCVAVRNPRIHGGLALRGKPMNVRGMKPIDIMKNKEIFELMTVIGLEFNKPTNTIPDLYEIVLDGQKYIVGENDVIIHSGKEIEVSQLINVKENVE